MWIPSRSSLPCIAPLWFHRTSFLGHDLLPSGCAPSVFVESYEEGPASWRLSFLFQTGACGRVSEKRGRENLHTAVIKQVTNMLRAYVSPNHGFELTRYLLLCNCDIVPLLHFIFTSCEATESNQEHEETSCFVLFLSHILTVWSISSCHTVSFPSPPFHHVAVHQGACDLLTPQYGDLLHHVKVETGDLRLQ